jgi:2'-5' RNA ligase
MSLHGIASRLDETHSARVHTIWDRLEESCSLDGIRRTPIPHLSWMIGEEFDFKRLEPALKRCLQDRVPLQLRTTGLGVFTGEPDIVLYIAVIKDAGLMAFHRRLWEVAGSFIERPSAYYLPDHWVPHITLAHGDVDPEALACAARLLAREQLHWTIGISEVSLIFQDEDDAVERARFSLSG